MEGPGKGGALARGARALWHVPRLLLVGVVRFYQLGISPWLPRTCRFTPSCSQYAILALREYGAVRGFVLAGWRILRCNPFGGQGYDPPRWFGEASAEGRCGCGEVAPSAPEPPRLDAEASKKLFDDAADVQHRPPSSRPQTPLGPPAAKQSFEAVPLGKGDRGG